jgi:hypothetical protein
MSYGKDKERLDAERYAAQNESARREDTAALGGMTLGILIALAVAVAAGTFLYLNRRDESTPTVTPATSPTAVPSASPAEKQTIIREEKTRELVPVPVPQSTAPQPNINITVPSAPSSLAPSSSSSEASPKESAPAASASPEAQSSPSLPPASTP